MIKEICSALIEADVNVKLVAGLRKSIKSTVNLKELGPAVNKKRLIQKVRTPEVPLRRVQGGVWMNMDHSLVLDLPFLSDSITGSLR
jgi:hypothetical protein